MDIRKESHAEGAGVPTEQQLMAINTLAKAELTKEQVYVFSLRLCDDQIDRDYERFDTAALPELAKMFIGKSGIVDHKWSSSGQLARIFSTEVVCQDGVSFIKAWAYIRRGGDGDEWIADIEAGIKKEVSVGCAMGESVCSICGAEYGSCGHGKGEVYDGQVCCAILRNPVDAYEFSFVAVPAQPNAGVLKGLNKRRISLKELADEHGAQEEFRVMFQLAQLGKQYAKQLEDDVVRMCLSLDVGIEEAVLRSAAGKMAPEELMKFKDALNERMAKSYPMQMQLGCSKTQCSVESGYLI